MEYHQSFPPSSGRISAAGKMPEVTFQISGCGGHRLISSSQIDQIGDLLDFAGYSWIAYGASSLLVISNFPNPSSQAEAKMGPVFRQVLELSRSCGSDVSAVSWSPADPSAGELGAAIDERIQLFSYDSDDTSSNCSSFSNIEGGGHPMDGFWGGNHFRRLREDRIRRFYRRGV